MLIGIIGPTTYEITPFINEANIETIETHAKYTFHIGKYNELPIVIVMCGVCKVNAAIATQILIDKYAVTNIFVTGVAGALDKNLEVGDTVIANEFIYHDVDENILVDYHPFKDDYIFYPDEKMYLLSKIVAKEMKFPIYHGRLVTGETFVTDKERDIIIKDFQPLCVDMETAAIAHVCEINNIPFLAIRSMSDSADEDSHDSFINNVKRAALNSLKILKSLLNKLKDE